MPMNINKIVEMFKAWISLEDIAKTSGVSPQLVRYHLKKTLGKEYEATRRAKIAYHDNYSRKFYHKNPKYRLDTIKRAKENYEMRKLRTRNKPTDSKAKQRSSSLS